MKKVLITILLISQLASAQNKEYQQEIKEHRIELNNLFKHKKNSPLPKSDLKKFTSLPFFVAKDKYKVNAKLTYTFNSPITYIQNTGGQTEAYQQYALATFTIDGKELSLSIYQSMSLKNKRGYENYLFIPFTDKSNGKTTYTGGRYLDTSIPKKSTGYIILDFNKAYNPYCAYNKKYVCPIPPKNNYLDLEILAGVKY